MPKISEEKLTLPQIFQARVAHFHSRRALLSKNKNTQNFEPVTWLEWDQFVRNFALGLFSLQVRRHDRVAILSENRPEWTYCDLGILSIGAAGVPIYPTSSPQDVAYILENAEVEVLIVSTPEHWERIKAEIVKNSRIRHVICMDTHSSEDAKLLAFSEVLKKGQEEARRDPSLYQRLVDTGDSQDTATLIYTSGTTGPAKGVMLTHANFVANYLGSKERIHIHDQDVALSFLPLSHVFERLAGYYFMIFHGAVVAYAESMQTVSEDILIIKPTICAAVPRFYEKVYTKILEKVEAGSALSRKIFYWAVGVGQERSRKIFKKEKTSFSLKIRYAIAKLLVFKKIRKKMGGRIRFFISGGAPLSKELAEFFFASDILILEGYGLTETSPVIAVNSPEDFRFGTVGRPLPNVEVKLAEDGEIITRGPCVMKGYYNRPEATAEAIQNGWFHTGDIGSFEDGFLKITDRKKDIIATSGGKKVSPQNIENKILADNLFLQVVILGDKRNYLVALVVPNRALVEKYAEEKGFQDSYETLLKKTEIFTWIDQRFRTRTENLASYEQIKYIALLPKEFTQESGELTPTLKCKRRFIMEKYKSVIDELYSKKAETISSASLP